MKFIYTKEKAGDIIEQLNFAGSLEGGEVVQGEKGDTGEQGIQGFQGIQGIQGIQGDTGIQGIQGETGIQGIQGDKGDKGDTGEQGIQGIQGERGADGTGTGGGGGMSLDDGREIKQRYYDNLIIDNNGSASIPNDITIANILSVDVLLQHENGFFSTGLFDVDFQVILSQNGYQILSNAGLNPSVRQKSIKVLITYLA